MRGEAARLRTRLDKLWAECVKLNAGMQCTHCGKTEGLNSHHIYSRSKKSTRWDLDNGDCLCVACHTFSSSFSAHKTPMEYVDHLNKTRGEEKMDFLRLKANKIAKHYIQDLRDMVQHLKEEKERLESLQ